MLMKNTLIQLLNQVFNEQGSVKNDEYLVHCPYCFHNKKKLSVNLNTGKYHCWVCGKAGVKLDTLFFKMGADKIHLDKLHKIFGNSIVSSKPTTSVEKTVSLPLEYMPIWAGSHRSPDYRNVVKYLKRRNIGKYDILRYNIGYCEDGPYGGMIILPSYDKNGILNYFVGRSFYDGGMKHKNPMVSKDIIGNELLINWNEPINIVEGMFDAIAVGDNTIPLFGKFIPTSLKLKIIEEGVKRINILLDGDAIKQSIEHAEYFMNNGISVHLIDMGNKDPSELGHQVVTSMIEKSVELDLYKIMELKFEN